MTFEKFLTLNNILYVVDIRKNLASGSLSSKNGFKMVFESDKFVLIKNGIIVVKGYLYDDIFKMNVITIVTKDENNNVASSYLLEPYNVGKWYLCDDIFKMNVMTILTKGENNNNVLVRIINHDLLQILDYIVIKKLQKKVLI